MYLQCKEAWYGLIADLQKILLPTSICPVIKLCDNEQDNSITHNKYTEADLLRCVQVTETLIIKFFFNIKF